MKMNSQNGVFHTITGYVARNKNGNLAFFMNKPETWREKFWTAIDDMWIDLDTNNYPGLKWEDEPKMVEVHLVFDTKEEEVTE